MGFRKARIAAGLSVAQVMEALKVSDAAVYQWETGVTHPSIKRLPEVAKLYGCSVDELLAPDSDE
ncbi:MAG: helix-turn-helix transcriptional regulator [Akkermansia sp.]|nr:helix-turn-helix transcriptional regulator [Akkermansia sp.]